MAKHFGDLHMDVKTPRLEDLVDLFKFPPKEPSRIRLVGPSFQFVRYWFTIKTTAKVTTIPKMCLDWNPEKDDFMQEICPYRKNLGEVEGAYQEEHFVLQNAIIRDLQDTMPARFIKPTQKELIIHTVDEYKMRIKDGKGSPSWTPVRIVLLKPTIIRKIGNQDKANKHEGKIYPVNHPIYGYDISITFDPDETGTGMYSLNREARSPLSKEERAYLHWNLLCQEVEDLNAAKASWKWIKSRICDKDGNLYYGQEENKRLRTSSNKALNNMDDDDSGDADVGYAEEDSSDEDDFENLSDIASAVGAIDEDSSSRKHSRPVQKSGSRRHYK